MDKKRKSSWILLGGILAAFLAMAATGFLMGHPPKAVDSMLRKSLKDADDEQGMDAMKLKLPRIDSASSPAASK